jgi:DNA-binding transcriptional MerR regulator
MQIAVLAKAAGVSVQTVRYYERSGLMPRTDRKPSLYRVYTDQHLHRLRFIRHAKTLGFSLDDIKEILALSQRQHCPCGRVLQIAEHRLVVVSAQIEQLLRLRAELSAAVATWRKTPKQAPSGNAICVLIERTMEKEVKDDAVQSRRNVRVPGSRVRM